MEAEKPKRRIFKVPTAIAIHFLLVLFIIASPLFLPRQSGCTDSIVELTSITVGSACSTILTEEGTRRLVYVTLSVCHTVY